jgi:hypothetical protein
MSYIKQMKSSQDIFTVAMIGLILLTGIAMILLSVFYTSSFLAILGISLCFWSILLLFFTPTRHVFLSMLKASASASGSNIERSLLAFELDKKGIYLPPQNLRNFESSVVFVPKTEGAKLPTANETSDSLFTEKKTGFFFTPPGFALSELFEKELGLSFRKIALNQMQATIKTLLNNLKFADDVRVRIENDLIFIEVTGSIFNALCQETQNTQPRTHAQIGCIFASAFACAFAKASDKPITIQQDTVNPDTKTLTVQYRMEEAA